MYVNIAPNTTRTSGAFVEYMEKEHTTARDFTEYLDKESRMDEKEYFFNHEDNFISKEEATDGIDNNSKRFTEKEHRFFSLTFNPSDKEIAYLQEIAAKRATDIIQAQKVSGLDPHEQERVKDALVRDLMKEYTRVAMDEYARNFGREGINSSADLVWYGKVERERYWKPTSKEVQHNRKIERQIAKAEKRGLTEEVSRLRETLIKESDVRVKGRPEPIREWMPKSGDNYHIHVIVSRQERSGRRKLSPLANERGTDNHKINGKRCKIGFNRDLFAEKVEISFDKYTGYERSYGERYQSRKLALENPEQYEKELREHIRQSRIQAREQSRARSTQIPTKEMEANARKLIEKYAYHAGERYLENSIYPLKRGHKVMSIFQLNAWDKNRSQYAQKLLGKAITEYARCAGMSHLAAMNPYVHILSLASRGISRALNNRDGMEY